MAAALRRRRAVLPLGAGRAATLAQTTGSASGSRSRFDAVIQQQSAGSAIGSGGLRQNSRSKPDAVQVEMELGEIPIRNAVIKPDDPSLGPGPGSAEFGGLEIKSSRPFAGESENSSLSRERNSTTLAMGGSEGSPRGGARAEGPGRDPGRNLSSLDSTNNDTNSSTGVGNASGPSQEKPKRVLKPKRDAIVITDAAAARISALLKTKPEAIGLVLGVKRRGCNGLSYTLDFKYPNPNGKPVSKFEDKVEHNGATVYLDPKSLLHIIGTKMDFVDEEIKSGFEFTNPNSKGSCGCGESFNV